MRDRTPTRALENGALRYGVYDEAGNLLRYEYLALEDEPTDPGTDLSKATLLQDSTEVSLFGSTADRTVDDVFAGLAGQLKLIMSDTATITLTLKDSGGHGLPGVLVQGILSESGTAVYSNDSGVAAGYIGEGNQTIKVSGYADIADYSEVIAVTKGTAITKTVTLTTRDFLKITSSQSVKFSGNVSRVDVSVGAAGGAGACTSDIGSKDQAPGGGGGHAVKAQNVSFSANQNYPAVIGSGGKGKSRSDGGDGGSSSFLGVTAQGGTGGKLGIGPSFRGIGNGNGGYVTSYPSDVIDGEAGTETMYSSIDSESPYGGGGGALNDIEDDYSRTSNGGSPGGGAGASSGQNGVNGLGGGGGAGKYTGSGTKGGDGGSGCVAIRMHLKSAA